MITHLVDADCCIDYINGIDRASQLLDPLVDDGHLAVSVIAVAEVHEGLVERRSPRKIAIFEDFVEGAEVIPVFESLIPTFVRLRHRLRTSGQAVGDHDIWIAATALEYDLKLISRDKHFERMPELKRERYR